VNYCNMTASAIVPTTETYVIGNFQAKAPGRQRGVPGRGSLAGRHQHARQRGALGARRRSASSPASKKSKKKKQRATTRLQLAGDPGGLS
jgi:hypothetical protein